MKISKSSLRLARQISAVLVFCALLGLADACWAAGPVNPTTATWTAPTTNTDGSPLTDLGNYKVYTATGTVAPIFPGTAWSVLSTVPAGAPNPVANTTVTFPIPSTPNGQRYMVITAVDTAGNESAGTPAAPFLVDRLAPSVPTQLNLQ